MRHLVKGIILILLLAIQSCTSRQGIDQYASNNDYEKILTHIAINIENQSITSADAIRIANQNPEIIQFSDSLFSEQSIQNFAVTNQNIEYLQFRLKAYCSISTTEKCNAAIENLGSVEKTIKNKITVLEDLYQKLTLKEQKSLSDKYRLEFYKSSEIGTITDRQIQNLSTPGSNAGAEIGGAIGTAAYINNATPSSYSMKSDIASTALGALAGAVLLNKNPTVQYLIRYTIKLRNGEIIQVDQISSTPLGQGVGMCISASNASPIDQSYCTMTLDEFRVKYSNQIKE